MAKFSKKDYQMFDLARKRAQESDFKNFFLGCVITYKGHVISTGHNSNKSHPMQKRYNLGFRSFKPNANGKPINHSLHAEMSALVDIPYPLDQQIDYSQVKVYIYRICLGKPLRQGLARPCPACMAALRDKGIRHLYFTTDTGFCYEELC